MGVLGENLQTWIDCELVSFPECEVIEVTETLECIFEGSCIFQKEILLELCVVFKPCEGVRQLQLATHFLFKCSVETEQLLVSWEYARLLNLILRVKSERLNNLVWIYILKLGTPMAPAAPRPLQLWFMAQGYSVVKLFIECILGFHRTNLIRALIKPFNVNFFVSHFLN